jgi:hypothetical protein
MQERYSVVLCFGLCYLVSVRGYVVCDRQLDNNFEAGRLKVLGTYPTAV